MPASEATGFPGQLDVGPELGAVELAGASYLVYPRARHDAFAQAPGTVTVCLVGRDRSAALRATLQRLTDASLPAHRVVVIDGGSDDWSLSDAIAHAAHRENAIVYQSPRDATIGEQFAAVLEVVGSGTSVLAPLHPELAAAALAALAPALGLADDILGAIAGSHPRLLRGEFAARLRTSSSPPFPLLALRGPISPPARLARCTTTAEVALALGDVLRRGHCVIAELPPIAGWTAPSISPAGEPPATTGTVDTTMFWPGVPPLRLGQDGSFTFLLVTPWGRAGWEATVDAYVRTFTATDAVSLALVVVGTAPPEHEAGAQILAVIAAARPGGEDDVPDISLHTTPSVLEHLPAIYTGADCLIYAGDERSAIEAMASGLPLIAPSGSGPDDLLDEASGYLLDEATGLGGAMAAALADREGAATRGAEARRRVVRRSAVDEQALDRPEQAL